MPNKDIVIFQQCGGTGIKIVNNKDNIPNHSDMIVQKYIENPHLINGTKYDLRIYVLLTSVNPLHIYLFDEGHTRFATMPYDRKKLSNLFAHLTNYSLNKRHKNFVNRDMKMKQWHEYLDKNGIDKKLIWKTMQDIIIKAFLVGEKHLFACSHRKQYDHFEVCNLKEIKFLCLT